MPIPIVDIKDKRISGTKKNSFDYFHEKEHIKFSESNLGMNFQWFGQISEYWTIIFIVISLFIDFFKYISMIGVVFMLFFFIFEEVYCNYKAMEELKKRFK